MSDTAMWTGEERREMTIPASVSPTWQWVAALAVGALGTIALLIGAHLLAEFSEVKKVVHSHDTSIEVIKMDVGIIRSGMERLLGGKP